MSQKRRKWGHTDVQAGVLGNGMGGLKSSPYSSAAKRKGPLFLCAQGGCGCRLGLRVDMASVAALWFMRLLHTI